LSAIGGQIEAPSGCGVGGTPSISLWEGAVYLSLIVLDFLDFAL